MKRVALCACLLALLCGVLTAESYVIADRPFSSRHMIGKGGQPVEVPLKGWKGEKGAMVMKVTPQDWSSETKNTAVFARATKTPNSGFLLYTINGWDLALSTAVDKHHQTIVFCPRQSLWNKGESHVIVLNWDRNKFASLYVDGKLKASQKGVIHIPDLRHLVIGTEGSWGNSHSTLVQGYRVLSRPLTDAEIMSYSYDTLQQGKGTKETVLPFAAVTQAPVVDGVIGDGEYPVQLEGLVSVDQHALAKHQNLIYTGHDENNLYFAMKMAYPNSQAIVIPEAKNDSEGLAAGPDVFALALRTEDTDLSKKAFNAYSLTIYPDGKFMDCHEVIDWVNPAVKRNTACNVMVAHKAVLKDNQLVIELAMSKEQLQLGNKDRFLISFGTVMHNKRYAWKDHTSWFDSYDAFTLATLGTVGVRLKHPALYKGVLDTELTVGNNANAPVSLDCAAEVSGADVTVSSKEQIDDILVNPEISLQKQGNHFKLSEKAMLQPKATKRFTQAKTLQKPGFYVYDFAISAGGQTVASRELPFMVNPPLEILLEPLPSSDRLLCTLTSYEEGLQGDDQVFMEFRQNKNVVKTVNGVWKSAVKGFTFSMKDLKPGTYQVRVKVLDARNQVKVQGEQVFVKKPLPEWLVDRKGLEALSPDWAPAPWGKIRYEGTTLKLWAGDIQFGSQGMVQQFTGRWQNMLAAPVQFHYRRQGKDYTIALTQPVWQQKHDGLAVFKQEGRSQHLRAEILGQVEFDGFMKFDIKLIPLGKTLDVELVWADYTVRNGKQFWSSGSGFKDQLGYVKTMDFYKTNYLWVGNDSYGLNWLAENQKGWVIHSQKPRVSLVKQGADTTVKLLLVNEPSRLTQAVACTMALQPTPIKTPIKDWRKTITSCMSGYRMQPINLVMVHPNCYNAAGLAHPEPRNPQIISDWQQAGRKQNQDIFVYLTPYMLCIDKRLRSDAPAHIQDGLVEKVLYYPEGTTKFEPDQDYEYFKAEWRMLPERFFPATPHTAPMAYFSPASSWTDYLSYKIHKILTVYKLQGIYFDLAAPRTNGDPRYGYAYKTKDQKNEMSVELFASRALFKRLYAVFKSVRGYDVPTVICHSFPLATPCASFWDYALTGEGLKVQKRFQFTEWMTATHFAQEGSKISCVKNEDDPYDPVGMRINFSQTIWGVPPMVLPQYGYNARWGWRGDVAREVLSLGLSNGSAICSNLISYDIFSDVVTDLQQQFGLTDVEFHPYWDNEIHSSAREVKVSYYKKKQDDDYLLVVSNISGKTVKTQLTLPPQLQSFHYLYDIEKTYKNMVHEPGQTLDLTVGPHDFKMIRFLLKK